MGVLNVTPDSFSHDGIYAAPELASERAIRMVAEGADIIDVGGESTRPGHRTIDLDEEMQRVLPVIARMPPELAAAISIDTSKPDVASAACAAGATIINDVSGLRDPEMLDVAARTGAWTVLVHSEALRADADGMGQVVSALGSLAERAVRAGVRESRLIVDPGLGMGKGWESNFLIMRRLRELRQLGFPILVGPSRKGMIGRVLGVGVQDRLEGTVALVTLCVARGADIVRVHDVREMVDVVRVTDALIRVGDGPSLKAGRVDTRPGQ